MKMLADIQQQFSHALLNATSTQMCGVIGDHFSAQERIQIYRNNFIISLSEVLQATYPITFALVGEECFRAIAKYHIIQHPPESANTLDYGAGFERSIAALEHITSAVPYLLDVINFEWKIDQASRFELPITSGKSQPIIRLANVPEELHGDIQLLLNPSTQVISSQYALIDLKQAVENHHYDQLNFERPQMILLQGSTTQPLTLSEIDVPLSKLITQLMLASPLRFLPPEQLALVPTLLSMNIVTSFSVSDGEPT
ncbi:DNA-binding domain-containing protein [Vibrio sp. ZSDZ65]|uniref:DNA-binding domain-containing protein n=1 Tax=Vibrio qingdaonensis TaxID=2829491 RepID=A0A9X3CSP1_9VIBR|nr:DNA-binding domain-containing protein [Vibrio qingdaonensis]MCW8348839.1 DNA-binding domain-containing protein [Vibrio qingdaonensis]